MCEEKAISSVPCVLSSLNSFGIGITGKSVLANPTDLRPFHGSKSNLYGMAHVLKFYYPPTQGICFPRSSSEWLLVHADSHTTPENCPKYLLPEPKCMPHVMQIIGLYECASILIYATALLIFLVAKIRVNIFARMQQECYLE